MSIRPLHDRVLVRRMEDETVSAGGILIPDNAKEKPQKGKVVAAGKGTKDEPITVKVGDTVLYGKYAGTEIAVEIYGERCRAVVQEDAPLWDPENERLRA